MDNPFLVQFGLPHPPRLPPAPRQVSLSVIEGPLETALRWDQVADLAYGDPFDYERLIRASLALAITPVLEPGDVIVAPVLAEASTPSAGLPPWKRP